MAVGTFARTTTCVFTFGLFIICAYYTFSKMEWKIDPVFFRIGPNQGKRVLRFLEIKKCMLLAMSVEEG